MADRTAKRTIHACRRHGVGASAKLIEEVIRESDDIVRSIADPFSRSSRTAGRTRAALARNKVSRYWLETIPYRDRVALAQESCYKVLRSFVKTREKLPVWTWLSKYAPREFARIVKSELPDVEVELWGIIRGDSRVGEQYIIPELPSSAAEYLHMVQELGSVRSFGKLLPSVKRDYLYALVKRLQDTIE